MCLFLENFTKNSEKEIKNNKSINTNEYLLDLFRGPIESFIFKNK